jgi:Rps23 Pro-64 3,4-dihydroxylase Tpa1-like proline 4-hydroxylase
MIGADRIDDGGDPGGVDSRMQLTRMALAEKIGRSIQDLEGQLARAWRATAPINHFVVDDLLPVPWAKAIRSAFPQAASMTLSRSLRELKCVAAQMNRYHPLLEEIVYAFQATQVVSAIERITGLEDLEPDEQLYAGGVSLMARGHFLNPHIDNSHDKLRRRYRMLNLLYYVSPDWPDDRGGNLELWPNGVRGEPTTVVSRFNRLGLEEPDRRGPLLCLQLLLLRETSRRYGLLSRDGVPRPAGAAIAGLGTESRQLGADRCANEVSGSVQESPFLRRIPHACAAGG